MSEQRSRDLPWLSRLAQRWFERNTLPGDELPTIEELALCKRASRRSVSVALPALNEEETIGEICRTIRTKLMRDFRVVDELVVLDGGSTDATAERARAAGARVVDVRTLVPQIPFAQGKGESLWRSLSILRGDIICWIDADIRNFEPHFVTRLVAPLILDDEIAFVKAFYNRPIAHGETLMPEGGGRVTELLARPLLNALFPELSGMLQPLSGEYAGRADVLGRIPFFTGYSVEVGLLIDLVSLVGLEAIAQVDLDERVHRNRPLEELGPMAYGIAKSILSRAEDWGRIKAAHDYAAQPLMLPDRSASLAATEVSEQERPPMATLRAPASTATTPRRVAIPEQPIAVTL